MARNWRTRKICVFVLGFCCLVGVNGQPLIQTRKTDGDTLDLSTPGLADLYEDVRQQAIELSNAEHKVSLISKNLMESYEKDIAKVKKVFTELSTDIEITSQNITKFEDLVNETESSLEEFSEKLNGLSKNLSDMISQAESQQTRDAVLDGQIQSLMYQTNATENVSQIIKSNFESLKMDPVGFTVYLGQDTNYTDKTKIEFEEVITNIGNQFCTESGVFSCQKSGMYLFTATICAQIGSRAHASIVHDNVVLSRLIAEDKTTHDCGSTSVVVEVRSGENIWMRSEKFSLFDAQSYFSGVLIRKTT